MSKCPTWKQEVPKPKCAKCLDSGTVGTYVGEPGCFVGRKFCDCPAGLAGGTVEPRDIADYKEKP